MLGFNHKTTAISIRDKLSAEKELIEENMKDLQQRKIIDEFFILSTCNRFEVYFKYSCSSKEEQIREFTYLLLENLLAGYLKYKDENLSDYIYYYSKLEVVEHLYKVASGLDSLVTGESQILSQLKKQFKSYRKKQNTATYLNQLFLEAIRVAKKVRTETAIGEKAVSISYAAVELARDIFGDLNGEKVMILGAGETAELSLKNLVNYGVEGILVANRTYENGKRLAAKYGGEVIRWEKLKEKISEVDIVIASTAAPHTVLKKDDITAAMVEKHGPMFLIDIALPRDIDKDVEKIRGVHLYNIDDLKQVIDKNLSFRQNEMQLAEKIIAEEKLEYNNWLRERRCVPLIKEMREEAEKIKKEEVSRALHLLKNSEHQAEEIMEQLGHRLLNKLLHQPTVGIKKIVSEDEKMNTEKLRFAKKIFSFNK